MKKYIGLIIGMLPLLVSAQMVLTNNYYAVLSGGSSANPTTVVLTNPNPSGITNTGTGWIVSENEFNQVVWQIGTNTGTYVVPFGDSVFQYLPVTLDISAAGTGNGVVKFSTYHSKPLNTPTPSDVTNLNAFILPGSPSNADDAYNIADRFYVIDANTGYTTKPAAGNITFSYISGTPNSEVAAPNVLVESRLMAERFNSTTDTWSDWFAAGCTDVVVGNVGTVQTGPVPAIEMYRSWALWDNLTPLPVMYTSTNVLCNGGSTGSITVTISGGVSPYTYTWTPNVSSSATATGLSAGTYSVSVADNTGCTSTIGPITITQPSVIDDSIVAASTLNVLCNGGSTGSATVGVIGGTSPYTYNWTPNVSSTATSTGLSAGTYSVNITDNNGCSSTTTSVTITQPSIIDDSIVAASVVNVLCNGNSTGSATVGVIGGTSPYTYNWTPNVSSTATATGLSAGTYSVNITDNNGCSSTTTSVTITQPSIIDDSIVAASAVNVLCNGNSTGSATVGVIGGTSPYTYNWTPNVSSTATATGLSAGTYSVNITDNNGCSSTTTSVTITQPSIIDDSIVAASVVNVLCNGNSTGSATVGVIGGTSPYTYNWTPNVSSTATATGLSAGTYSVSIMDNNGCSGTTTSVTITQPNIIDDSIVAASTVNVSCNGGSTGSATIGVIGGTTPYTYNWTPNVSSTATATGLSAGTYSVSIMDNNGCSGTTTSVTITQPNIIDDSIVAASTVNVSCNGGSTGSTTIGVIGGTTPYTYNWTPNVSSTATASGLSAGTYSVNITDNNGCSSSTTSVTITQPSIIDDSIVAASVVNVSCLGGSNGSATVGVIGGTSPYTYTWTPNVSNTATATGLSAGTYSVNITDNNGCSGTTASVTITQPTTAVRDSIVSITVIPVVCKGDSTGSATVGVIGGSTPYTYNWNPNISTSAIASGLSAGTYTVDVTDNNGCTGQLATVTISQPTYKLTDSVDFVYNVGCYQGDTGEISIGTRGGVGPYTYVWTPNVSTKYYATGLSAGTYTVSITDNIGCNHMLSVTVTQPSATLVASASSVTSPLCYGGNGSATIGVTGGTPAYTYLWTPNGYTTATVSTLSAGTYTVIVNDSHGCMSACAVTITQTAQIQATLSSSTDVLCNGNSTGSATVSVSGGSSPYTYAWTPNVSTTGTATGLSAGSYSVIVTDNNGCTSSTVVVNISQPSAISDNVMILSNVGCNGGSGGNASANVSGGISPYTYLWSPSGQTTYSATGLTAGTYTVSVTDNNGCNNTMAVTITQPSVLIDTVTSVSAPLCSSGTGSATIGVSGGTPGYTYQWTSNVSTTSSASNLSAGTYTVMVTDAHGCSASCTVTINQAAPIVAGVTSMTDVLCNGNSTGAATIGVSGGTSPYTYAWTPNVSTTGTATGLSAGSYSVVVTDNNGCTSSTVVVNISQPSAISDNVMILSNVGCNGGSGGSASANVSGGTSPYTYLWSPSGQSTYSATGLTAGTYTVSVTDNNGCNNTMAVTITQPANALRDTVTSITNLVCSGLGSSATVGTVGGTSPYTYSWNPNVSSTASCSSLNVGVYTVTVNDANGCMASCTVDISQPAPIYDSIVAALTINVSCQGGSNGSATVGVLGGFSPYTYTWMPNVSSTATATGLSAGTYSVIVNDSHGCSGNIATVTITQPAIGIKDSAAVLMNVGCFGGNAGSISIGTRGGVAPYTYVWSPNVSSTYQATGLSAGTYSVTVTDKNGCSNTLAVTVTQPTSSVAVVVTSTTYPVCYGGTGTASVGASGGSSPYTYAWTSAWSTTNSATAMVAGYYTITVTDSHGCNATTSVTITQPAQMIINTVYANVTSHAGGGCNGIAGITSIVGGTPPYTYLWTPGGQTTDSITRQCAGDYCVTVTDAHGCSENTCISIATTVGIPTISGSSTISVYPDPNNGMFTVAGVTQGQIIEIYNAIGQQLTSAAVDNNSTMYFNIADKANGVYLVRILNKDGSLAGETKMIKTK